MFHFSYIILLISSALLGTAVADMEAAHNATVKLTCIAPNSELFAPDWFMDGAPAAPLYAHPETGVTTLIIDGNLTCGTFDVYCSLRNGQIMFNTTLTVNGSLPLPENTHINESNNALVFEWNPPYSEINTNSRVVDIYPHITQYTVYIFDNYTGNYLDKVNVTETSFRRNISDDNSCPMYAVSAWNSGGEGNMSAPLPGYLPRIPSSIAAEDVDIRTVSGALDIRLHVNDTCTVRMPNSFLVTVMSTDGDIIKTVQHSNTNVYVRLPQNVEDCNLIVRISAVNSAGISPPTNIPVGCQTTYTVESPATTPTARSTGSDTTSTDQNQQGDNIIYIATAVGAVVIVGTGTLLLIVLWRCKRNTKVEKPDEVVMHHNQAYETVTRTSHSRPATEVPTGPCPAYGVVGAHRI